MKHEEFYGDTYPILKSAEQNLLNLINEYPNPVHEDVQTIVYCCSRIKSPESMMEKLKKRGLSADLKSALHDVYDAVGIRIICSFAEDIYLVAAWLKKQPYIRVIQEKDYFRHPKPNGYRSYHMTLELQSGDEKGYFAEIQIRTIATDCWATLEHQLKYKKEIPHEDLIRSELKRCADEIASVDLSMQTIRDIIRTIGH